MVIPSSADAGDPVARPVELVRARDRHQAQVALREPLLEEDESLVLRLGYLVPQDQLEASTQVAFEGHDPAS
jgi:hypothetical protein